MKSAIHQQPRVSQFRLQHLMLMTFSFASAGALYNFDSGFGILMLLVGSGFWSGFALIGVSNFFDTDELETKGLTSSMVYTAGMLSVRVFGVMGGSLSVLLGLSGLTWLMGI